MAYEESLRSVSMLADASCSGYTGPPGYPGSAVPNSGKIYRFVKITGKNTVGLATTKATDHMFGVLQNKPQHTGDAATVAIRGISHVIAGETLDPGDLVTCDAEGKAIVAAGADLVYGVVVQGAGVEDAVAAVKLVG